MLSIKRINSLNNTAPMAIIRACIHPEKHKRLVNNSCVFCLVSLKRVFVASVRLKAVAIPARVKRNIR